jgi:hypothetical protein
MFIKDFKTTNKREIILEFSISVILREKNKHEKKYYALEKFLYQFIYLKNQEEREKNLIIRYFVECN